MASFVQNMKKKLSHMTDTNLLLTITIVVFFLMYF